MAEPFAPRPAFGSGEIDQPGLRLSPVEGLSLASLHAGREAGPELVGSIRTTYELDLPRGSTHVEAAGIGFIGTGPGAWLALGPDPRLAGRLAEAVLGHAAVADQSGAYGVLDLQGAAARDLLARGVCLDLDPEAFPEHRAAVCLLGHLGLILWRLPGPHHFRLALARSTAADAWRFLAHAAHGLGPLG